MFADALRPYRGKLMVACSGGADSLALAHAATVHARQHQLPPPLVTYINHNLRPEAAAEGRLVALQAARLGAEFCEQTVDVSARGSLEAAARDARYAALQSLATRHSADWVLLGHTRSDQVETVFMRIVRGTGLVGLGGIPKERPPFCRPFLEVCRRDTENYCHHEGLEFVVDPMNQDERFTRVRVRHHWLPELRRENPKVDAAILRLADSARDYREVVEWAANEFLTRVRTDDGALRTGEPWRKIPDELAIRALVLHAAEHNRVGLETTHLHAILGVIRGTADGSAELSIPGGTATRSYDRFLWTKETVESPFVGAIPQGYQLRCFQSGDRMRPKRLKGRSRKLSDLFIDAKIPRHLRATASVVIREDGGVIVWAQYLGYAFASQIRLPLAPSDDENGT